MTIPFFESIHLSGNWIDIIFIVLLSYFLLTNGGFIDTVADVLGFLFSLIFSYSLYRFFGQLLISGFALPKGLSNASGFFIAWLISEVLVYMIFSVIILRFFRFITNHPLNKILGFIPAIFQTCLLFLFFISLIFALPVRGQVKEEILESRTGPFFVTLSQDLEKQIKGIFGEAVSETLNFITIKPQSNEVLSLGFRVAENKLANDAESEKIMFDLINQERQKRGIKGLSYDYGLRELSRMYGREMLINGFFSHTSQVDASSPADRANRGNVTYFIIGENLAYAPDVYLAHQGLMNSEGHRKNILSEDYGKAGIGVIDAGVYGKIFVQEFTN